MIQPDAPFPSHRQDGGNRRLCICICAAGKMYQRHVDRGPNPRRHGTGLLRQLPKLLGRVGDQDAIAGQDDRASSLRDFLGGQLDLARVTVVGGEEVFSETILNQLRADGITVNRIDEDGTNIASIIATLS